MVTETDTSLLDRDKTTAASYAYDAGNRVAETVATGMASATSFYLTDTQNPTGYAQPVEVWTSADGSRADAGLQETYLLGDRVLGQVDASGTVSYLLTDGHGSTRQMTDAAGLVTHAFTFDTFGTALNLPKVVVTFSSSPFLRSAAIAYTTRARRCRAIVFQTLRIEIIRRRFACII